MIKEIDDWNLKVDPNLHDFLERAYKKTTVYPDCRDTFNAFEYTDLKDVRVVMLGQDPYHTPGVAHGLAFSTQKDGYMPPSVLNMFKELAAEGIGVRTSPDLTDWARGGVLLLNTALTVEKGKAGSHANIGWNNTILSVFDQLKTERRDVVYVLMGSHAKEYEKYIDLDNNFVIKTKHPSPFSAKKGFFGSDVFTKTNELLAKTNQKPIDFVGNDDNLNEHYVQMIDKHVLNIKQ